MDPQIAGPVAAEVRTMEQEKPARPAPFRYNRARAEIKKAQDRLAQVKREARGASVRGGLMSDERAFLEQVDALRIEFRAAETTDDRRTEIRKILREARPRVRMIHRTGVKVSPSLSAQLVLPLLKEEMRAMMWAWATARATEVDSGLNQDARIQLLPLRNGKWARLKLPEGNRVLRWEGSSTSEDIEDFRSWTAWNYLESKKEEVTLAGEFDEPIVGNVADGFLKGWAIKSKTEG